MTNFGRRPAFLTLFAGLGIVIAAAAVPDIRDLLVPRQQADLRSGAHALIVVWAVSVLFIGIGLSFGVWDWLRLHREWSSANNMKGSRRDISPVSPGTVIGDRLRAVTAAVRSSIPPATRWFDSQRSQADNALSSIGAVTRFISSLLLLLAVIGTFAGMKAALPELVEAIRVSGQVNATVEQPEASASIQIPPRPAALQTALQYVGDAFGANFVALLGSLALAIISAGAGIERRSLLQEIELVSDEHIYPRLPAHADPTSLQLAIEELRQGVTSLTVVAASNRELRDAIKGYTDTLSDSLGELRTSFGESLRSQSTDLQRQINNTVDRLARDIAGIAGALAETAAAHETLGTQLGQRHADIESLTSSLAAASGGLTSQLDRLLEGVTQVTTAATDSHAHLLRKGDAVIDEVWRARESMQAAGVRLTTALDSMKEIASSFKESNQQFVELRRAFAEETREGHQDLLTALSQLLKQGAKERTDATTQLQATLTRLEQATSAYVESHRNTTATLAASADGLGNASNGLLTAVNSIESANEASLGRSEALVTAFTDITSSIHGTSKSLSELMKVLQILHQQLQQERRSLRKRRWFWPFG